MTISPRDGHRFRHFKNACLASLCLLTMSCGQSSPDTSMDERPAGPAEISPDEAFVRKVDTLNLLQVAGEPPIIDFYAVAHGAGEPIKLPAKFVTAKIGGQELTVVGAAPVGVATVLLIDTSRSAGGFATSRIQAALAKWVSAMAPDDRAAIMTFGSSVTLVQYYTSDKTQLARALYTLEANDPQTRLYNGLARAIDQARRADAESPIRRAVLVVTDGIDDEPAGTVRQEVIASLTADHIPLYVLGILRDDARGRGAMRDVAELAAISHGEFASPSQERPVDLTIPMDRLIESSAAVSHYLTRCDACPKDGTELPVSLTATIDKLTVRSGEVQTRFGPFQKIAPTP